MKIFVTGATGVLGQRVVKALRHLGGDVLGLSRSDANWRALSDLGAEPVSVDLYDSESLRPHLTTCDAVLHLASSIPKTEDLKRPDVWADNDRIRADGTRALVDAAISAGSVKTFVYPSVVFMYADKGSDWQCAQTARLEVPAPLRSTLMAESHVARFAAVSENHRGCSLRFGAFYGPDSRDSSAMLNMARWGFAMPFGPPTAFRSMIWIDDAAAAVVDALHFAPSGIYDVVEDQPFTQAQAINALAKAVGRKALFKLPRFLLRFVLRPEMCELLARSQRIKCERFREVTGWTASVPNQDAGWARIATLFERYS